MATTDRIPSSTPVVRDYLPPYDRTFPVLEDYEEGGIALSDSSLGLQVQMWHLVYDADENSPNYGDFTITAENTGASSVLINVPAVVNCSLAFDQNMRAALCYETEAGDSFYWWYDTQLGQTVTTQLPAGSVSPYFCLDDHRALQDTTSDMILGYVRGATLYWRMQRERFDTERVAASGVSPPLNRIGMTENLRVKFDVGFGNGVTLCKIVGDLCELAGVTDYDVSELCDIYVRGYMVNQHHSSAECIRGLQRVYFFDMPEVDGELYAMLRGRDPVVHIPNSDVVYGNEVTLETAREQEVEFPFILHLHVSAAEGDYAPAKQTSERFSTSIQVRTEESIETAVNMEPAEAKQRVQSLHKMAWSDLQGKVTLGLSEKYSYLIPGNVFTVEVRPGVTKRVRYVRGDFKDGVWDTEGRLDRASTYETPDDGTAAIPEPPEPPQTSVVGETTWEWMDLPALLLEHDSLHYYVAGHGNSSAWRGFEVQREVSGEYLPEVQVTNSQTLGLLSESMAAAPREPADTVNQIAVESNKGFETITDERLLEGGNALLVGDEIVQFRDATEEPVTYTATDISFIAEDPASNYESVIKRANGTWPADGFKGAPEITVSGSSLNNGVYPIKEVQGTVLVLAENARSLADEAAGPSVTVTSDQERWRLSYLLRGRYDTTPAAHAVDDRLVLLSIPTLVTVPVTLIDETFNVRGPSIGQVPSDAPARNVTFTGQSQLEWAPIDLIAADNAGDWDFSWTPRYRLGNPATPVKSQYHYGWRLRITKGGTTVDYDVNDALITSFTLTSAQQTADFGGALTTPFDIDIMGLNQITGEGKALAETVS